MASCSPVTGSKPTGPPAPFQADIPLSGDTKCLIIKIPVTKAGGVVGAKYRAIRAPCGLCSFSSWSDARGLSTYTRVVRSVGREDRPPQWGVVHEHTRRPTPVFMNTKIKIKIFTGRPGHMKTGHPHLRRQLSLKGRSIVGRYSTANPEFSHVMSSFPLVMNKQRRPPAFVTEKDKSGVSHDSNDVSHLEPGRGVPSTKNRIGIRPHVAGANEVSIHKEGGTAERLTGPCFLACCDAKEPQS